jgi:hypothetical protein
MTVRRYSFRLEKECECVLQAEAAAAGMGLRPMSISPEVAQFTFKETGTEEAGAFEMTSFVSSLCLPPATTGRPLH